MTWRSPGQWTKRQQRLLLTAALWPLLYTVVLLGLPATRLWFVDRGWRMVAGIPTPGESLAMVLHAATLVEAGITLLLCALHLATTQKVPEPQRLPWLLLMLLTGPVTLPAYVWLWVLRPTPVERLRPPRRPKARGD